MKSLKRSIRETLKSKINIGFVIKEKKPEPGSMNRSIFIEVIEQLKKIEERKDFLVEEIGMDMTLYEDDFFSVIDNLFKLAFNEPQIELIQTYLYQLIPDKEWDGKITIMKGKKETTVSFKTPSDVWEVIKSFEK